MKDYEKQVFNWELANKIDNLEKKIDELTKTVNVFWEHSTAKASKRLADKKADENYQKALEDYGKEIKKGGTQ
jgi:predicted metalloenzyme YecM